MVAAALATGGDAVPPFSLAEHIFHDVAPFVEVFVKREFFDGVASLRNVMAATQVLQGLTKLHGIISLISQQHNIVL